MTFSSVLIKTSTIITLPSTTSQAFLDCGYGGLACSLRWRRKQLWVRKKNRNGVILPALSNETWLQDCLKRSAVKQVWVDRRLGQATILAWATIGRQVNKEVWIRIPTYARPPGRKDGITAWLLRGIDWLAGIGLLLLVSPLILLLMLLFKVIVGGEVLEKQWCVNPRGRLFERITFVTQRLWLRKTHLDRLPQLWNVVKGEMPLVGFRPRTLEEVLHLD